MNDSDISARLKACKAELDHIRKHFEMTPSCLPADESCLTPEGKPAFPGPLPGPPSPHPAFSSENTKALLHDLNTTNRNVARIHELINFLREAFEICRGSNTAAFSSEEFAEISPSIESAVSAINQLVTPKSAANQLLTILEAPMKTSLEVLRILCSLPAFQAPYQPMFEACRAAVRIFVSTTNILIDSIVFLPVPGPLKDDIIQRVRDMQDSALQLGRPRRPPDFATRNTSPKPETKTQSHVGFEPSITCATSKDSRTSRHFPTQPTSQLSQPSSVSASEAVDSAGAVTASVSPPSETTLCRKNQGCSIPAITSCEKEPTPPSNVSRIEDISEEVTLPNVAPVDGGVDFDSNLPSPCTAPVSFSAQPLRNGFKISVRKDLISHSLTQVSESKEECQERQSLTIMNDIKDIALDTLSVRNREFLKLLLVTLDKRLFSQLAISLRETKLVVLCKPCGLALEGFRCVKAHTSSALHRKRSNMGANIDSSKGNGLRETIVGSQCPGYPVLRETTKGIKRKHDQNVELVYSMKVQPVERHLMFPNRTWSKPKGPEACPKKAKVVDKRVQL